MSEMKQLKLNSAPFFDSDMRTVSVNRRQAKSLANRKAREMRNNPGCSDAIGLVHETENHFCVSVGFPEMRNWR